MAPLDEDIKASDGIDNMVEENLFEGLSEEQLDEFNRALQKLYTEEARDIEARLGNVNDPEAEIDLELDRLINEARGEDDEEIAEHQLSNDNHDYLSDIAVFEGDKRISEDVPAETAVKRKLIFIPRSPADLVKMLNSLSIKALVITLVVLSLLSGGLIMFSIANISAMNKKGDTVLYQPSEIKPAEGTNSANYMYIKRSQQLDGNNIVLLKMLSDELATVFYIDSPIDPEKYYISLRDDENNIYTLDKTFQENILNETPNTVFRFKPLPQGTKKFSLTIQNMDSGGSVSYNLELGAPIKYLPAKLIGGATPLAGDSKAFLSGAEFSSSGSTVYFFLSSESEGESVRLSDQLDENSITLNESSRKVMPTKKSPDIFVFENGDILGRMDFEPLRNVKSTVNVSFNNLFKTLELNQDIDIAPLFSDTPEAQKTITVGDYNIVLERAGIQGDNLIVVLHAEDTPLSARVNQKDIDRTEVQLDAEIIVSMVDGNAVSINGKCRSIKQGSDMIFSLSGQGSLVRYSPPEGFTLRIKSAMFKIDEAPIQLDLGVNGGNLPGNISSALKSVTNAFEQRLACKAGQLSISELTGFSGDVLNDSVLMNNYKPIPDLKDSAYSVEVLAYSINQSEMYAVLSETLHGSNEQKEIAFSRTHKIVAFWMEGGWVVVEDNLI